METLKAIFSRRSIRKYSDKSISEEDLLMLAKAGMQAPSARNKQPWHFIIINQRDKLDALAVAHPYGKMLKEAAAAIIVCGDKNLEEMETYLLQNCCAATQNILLAAHDLGLGAVWLGLQPREKRINDVKDLFNIPEYIFPVALLSVGYPGEEKNEEDRYKPERVKWNGWG